MSKLPQKHVVNQWVKSWDMLEAKIYSFKYQHGNSARRIPGGSPRKKESYIKITLFFYIRIKLVKPRMDFPGQFPKIFLTHQSFSLESLKHLCPHALTTNITS